MVSGLDEHFELIFKKKIPSRDSLDPVYTAPDLDLYCLPRLNISRSNDRWDEFNFYAIFKMIYVLSQDQS